MREFDGNFSGSMPEIVCPQTRGEMSVHRTTKMRMRYVRHDFLYPVIKSVFLGVASNFFNFLKEIVRSYSCVAKIQLFFLE